MEKVFGLLMMGLVIMCSSCIRDKRQLGDKTITVIKEDTLSASEIEEKKQFERLELLTSLMRNKVGLDSLLRSITHQERVKVISRLITYDGEITEYKDGVYSFSSEFYQDSMIGDYAWSFKTIFRDGKKAMYFKDYKVLCISDSNCNEYGFNSANSLNSPVILEVCGKKFLYSKIGFACNGTGCGCNLIMIYDIEKKVPTFIENYRINFDGYYLSDFNGDSIPDLLVMDQKSGFMEGFGEETTTLTLYDYKYKDGRFVPAVESKFVPQYYYKLLGLTRWVYYPDTYSIIENEWRK